MITPESTIAEVLDEHPELIDVLVEHHAHFRQFKNRLLRRVMGPRLTVAQAAGMANVPVERLLGALRRAAGLPETTAVEDWGAAWQPRPRPAELGGVSPERLVHLDVRPEIARGEEPFGRIMQAIRTLRPDQVLVLRTAFEPVPLYDVLGRRGLAHWTERHAADDWRVWFHHRPGGAAAARDPTPVRAERHVVDVRGLEPPQPLVLVLAALEALAPGERLEVLHDRRPMFLYPQLDERGFRHTTDEPEPGLVRITIDKPRGEA